MRYPPTHKENAHLKILQAASRGFRQRGYNGIGVDDLAQEASVTSGAFYKHFSSKAEAFREAAVAGLVNLRQNIERLQAADGKVWLVKFADFYMSEKRTCDLKESCPLQTLTPEVARADDATKTAYEHELLLLVEAIVAGLPRGSLSMRRKTAWSVLSLLSGGVSLARAAINPKVGEQIAQATVAAIITLGGS